MALLHVLHCVQQTKVVLLMRQVVWSVSWDHLHVEMVPLPSIVSSHALTTVIVIQQMVTAVTTLMVILVCALMARRSHLCKLSSVVNTGGA